MSRKREPGDGLGQMARGSPPGHRVASAGPSRNRRGAVALASLDRHGIATPVEGCEACPGGPMNVDKIIKWFMPKEERFRELLGRATKNLVLAAKVFSEVAHA